jgi:16S rRNA (uracil1498-N3)-methyltransferase
MARHRVFLGAGVDREVSDAGVVVEGEEAEHALKSKRVRVGDEIDAFDGRGLVLRCRVEAAGKRAMTLEILSRETVEPVRPAVEVFSATPKGNRLDKMIDMLAQVGAASWTPLDTKLGVVDPGANKIDRMERISVEAAKQCGRAHVMGIGRKRSFAEALEVGEDTALIVADASGGAYNATGRARVRVLVGPEGGLLPEELDAARGAGAQVVSLGPHAMRIETAAVVGVAVVMERESVER